MNYFGHAVVALARNEDPAFVLGAMLPDLSQMAGVRLLSSPNSTDDGAIEGVDAGVRFHILTDAHFHQTYTFRSLNRYALASFSQMGVSKGPARACAHIGVEMLIDAELALDQRLHKGYHDALRFGAGQPELLLSPTATDALRVAGLLQHLDEKGVDVHVATKERLAFRLERTLASRPRLSPTSRELSQMVDYLCDLKEFPERTRELMLELAPLLQGQTQRRAPAP